MTEEEEPTTEWTLDHLRDLLAEVVEVYGAADILGLLMEVCPDEQEAKLIDRVIGELLEYYKRRDGKLWGDETP